MFIERVLYLTPELLEERNVARFITHVPLLKELIDFLNLGSINIWLLTEPGTSRPSGGKAATTIPYRADGKPQSATWRATLSESFDQSKKVIC